MKYRKLGRSGLEVSVIGIGTWPIAGDLKNWGPVDDNESIAAIQEGIDLGISFIDTAPSYGYGHGEEIVGRAIAGRRDRVVLATKCGLVWSERGGRFERHLKRDSIRKECEASLRRLRVETIDLYQLHWPDPATPIGEALDALETLREQGKVRFVGLANFSCQQISEMRRHRSFDSLQTEISLVELHATDELVPYCREYGIGVIACGVLARGLLTGKFDTASRFSDIRATDPRFSGEAFRRNLQLVARLRSITARLGCTPGQLALAWAAAVPGVICALAGAKRASQVRENAAAADVEIPQAEMDELEALIAEQDAR